MRLVLQEADLGMHEGFVDVSALRGGKEVIEAKDIIDFRCAKKEGCILHKHDIGVRVSRLREEFIDLDIVCLTKGGWVIVILFGLVLGSLGHYLVSPFVGVALSTFWFGAVISFNENARSIGRHFGLLFGVRE